MDVFAYIVPGWHTTIYPPYYIAGKLLSILAHVLFIWLITIKVFKTKEEKYQAPLNIANLIFCILSTVLLGVYLFELAMACYSGYFYEQFSFFNRALGPYWISYIFIIWTPLLLTQLFWRKNNRLNINLALFIVSIWNLGMWFERLSIIITSFMRDW